MCDTDTEKFYVHLENLPRFSTHENIRKTFEEIPISPGGISFYGQDAFFVVYKRDTAKECLVKNTCCIQGKTISISIVSKCDFFKMRFMNVRKKLQFDVIKPRRIRPCKLESYQDKFKIFNPEEKEFKAKSDFPESNGKKKRKITPTTVSHINFCSYIFEKFCSDMTSPCAKRIKLDVTTQTAPLIIV